MTAPNQRLAKRTWVKINPPVFFSSAILAVFFVLYAVLDPDGAADFFGALQAKVTETAGWFYIMAVAGFLVFVVSLALSRFGAVRLGPDHSEPDYSNLSWFSMLFSAGMGIGLMFFGVAEPIMHYTSPPVGDPETVEAAKQAMRITFFHWGVHAWAIYAVVALSLAYFAFRYKLPLTIRSALYPLIGDRIYGPIGHAVDTLAVLGTIFGVATSLGFGVIQINSGLAYLFDVPTTIAVQIALIAIITAIATVSVGLGLDTGIRRISELNILLAVVLLAFVLVAGPTVFLMQTLVQNTGNYLSSLFRDTFNLYAYEPTSWIGGWTLFYWGWWIAWSPFVGMFIARVSRGRTIREFVVGVLLVPVGFTFMWMTFFGDTALHIVMAQGVTGLSEAVSADASVALFHFFEHLPFSGIMSALATLLVVTFFVTSSDSGSLVVDMLTSGDSDESPLWQRIFWAIIEGVVAAALLLAGGLGALQAATIASALPFAVIMIFMCWGLLRALKLEGVKQLAMQEGRLTPLGAGGAASWRRRLETIIRHPKKSEVLHYMKGTAQEAFDDVCTEFGKRGLVSVVKQEEDRKMWIEIYHGDEIDFYYAVHIRPYDPPAFALDDTRGKRMETLKYYRAEVFLKEGSLKYDIMGWSKESIINDVLDHYERHLRFLESTRGMSQAFNPSPKAE